MSELRQTSVPELGVRTTVVMDHETHGPRTLTDERDGLRSATVFPGRDEDFFSEEGYQALKLRSVSDDVLPLDSREMQDVLVDEIEIVSPYTLHVALYALQNPTAENIERALYLIGVSGDAEQHIDDDSLRPLPVPAPPGWDGR